MEKENKQRMVVCAAIKSKLDGRVICGARHYDEIMRAQAEAIGGRKVWLGAQQGFIDQWCVFMDRQEAWKVAESAGQIRFGQDYSKGTLFSEDLY